MGDMAAESHGTDAARHGNGGSWDKWQKASAKTGTRVCASAGVQMTPE